VPLTQINSKTDWLSTLTSTHKNLKHQQRKIKNLYVDLKNVFSQTETWCDINKIIEQSFSTSSLMCQVGSYWIFISFFSSIIWIEERQTKMIATIISGVSEQKRYRRHDMRFRADKSFTFCAVIISFQSNWVCFFNFFFENFTSLTIQMPEKRNNRERKTKKNIDHLWRVENRETEK
jgi:hypothetical protein